jgi:phage host-nuclease inhibitor protein Gam
VTKDDELVAAKTRRQVDNAVSWLEKRYFTEEVRAKKELNESAVHLAKANKSDMNSSR